MGVSLGLAMLLAGAGRSEVARAEEAATGALAAYVAKPDPSFQWVKRQERELNGVKVTELILTSQTWRDIVWKHRLYVVRPKQMRSTKQGILYITGGGWNDALEQPPAPDEKLPEEALMMSQVANQFQSPLAILMHVPFQPVFDGMVEDQIIAYTFDQYLKTQEADWPLLLPMVKSAVRAMDAVQQYTKAEWQIDIESFTVTGASKRGWTTWLTGAADPRATAIAPMVIDTLNMAEQMKHQLETWGEYSEQIEDYTKRGIQGQNQTAVGKSLSTIVDPYSYRERLTQPKLLIMGTNDRYWCLDALNIYWDDLGGEKHVLYVPNNGHGLSDLRRVAGTISAFHKQAAGLLEFPQLSWDLSEQGDTLRLVVRSDQTPKQVSAWVARSDTKDFREVKWRSQPTAHEGNEYTYELPMPEAGYAAMFGEAVYEADGAPYFLSTNVRIVGTVPAEPGKAEADLEPAAAGAGK